MKNQIKRTRVHIGAREDKQDDGSPVWNWYVQTLDDGNCEPVAGGYCATDTQKQDTRWYAIKPRESGHAPSKQLLTPDEARELRDALKSNHGHRATVARCAAPLPPQKLTCMISV